MDIYWDVKLESARSGYFFPSSVLQIYNNTSQVPTYLFYWIKFQNISSVFVSIGARGSVVVKALCYKPEGRGFDNRWGEFLNLPNPSGCTSALGFTQPLTEMSTRNTKIIMFLEGKVRRVRRADNLTNICEPIV
jgi:hypothetical protein